MGLEAGCVINKRIVGELDSQSKESAMLQAKKSAMNGTPWMFTSPWSFDCGQNGIFRARVAMMKYPPNSIS
jgi:hypothetical protein